ncbi:MAG: alpha/beta hydrolase [Planctomycetes bacterium]|nr:alpha/beta hydrolase [Planctomycetota bacterium]
MDKSQNYLEIEGFDGQPVRLNLEFSQIDAEAPIVIISHGFKAHKDWSFIPLMAQNLAFHGFHVLRFSNSHCGVVDESGNFQEREKFANNRLSAELHDFKQILHSCAKGRVKEFAESNGRKLNGIHLLGHSRGSANALIVASEEIDLIRIDSLVCLSPISHYLHYTKKQFADWLEQGFIEINEPNTGTMLRMNRIYRDDLFENAQRYKLQPVVERLAEKDLSTLFIRGNEDKYILLDESEELICWSHGKYTLEIITGIKNEPADHNFGMQAKASSFNAPMNWAFKILLGFLKIHSV